jgi:hypothetical protein
MTTLGAGFVLSIELSILIACFVRILFVMILFVVRADAICLLFYYHHYNVVKKSEFKRDGYFRC